MLAASPYAWQADLDTTLVVPALALGMRTILVHPDDPVPESSRAHAVAPDLWACAEALRLMLRAP